MPSRRTPPIGAGLRKSAVWPIALGVALGAAVASNPPRSFGERIGPLRPGPGRLVGIPYAPEGAPLRKAQRLVLFAEIQKLSPQGGANEDSDRRTPESLRQRAILELAQNNTGVAIRLLERALESLPAYRTVQQEANLRSDLSAAHLQRFVQGDSPISSLAALDEVARAVELVPNSPLAEKNLAALLHRLGLAQLIPSEGATAPVRRGKPAVDLADAIRHGDRVALGELPVPTELAEGVRRYREGLELRRAPALESAALAFADASQRFFAVGSPFASWADFRLAEVEYQAGEYPEALNRLAPLAASADPLLAGRSIWLVGTIHTQKGKLSAAAQEYGRAYEHLEAAGETEMSACARDLLAENLRLRDLARSAWNLNLAALADLDSVIEPQRQRQILSGAGATAVARARFAAARLLEAASYRAVEAGGKTVSSATRAHASRLRADLALQSGDLGAAREAWTEAQERLEDIPDLAVRGPVEGDVLLLGAQIAIAAGGSADRMAIDRALSLLSRVESGSGFRVLSQRRIELAAQRARLLALADRVEEAEAALAEVEQLTAATALELSTSRIVGVRSAYTDLVAAMLRKGNAIRAFEVLVRAQCWGVGRTKRCGDFKFRNWERFLPPNVVALIAWPTDSQLLLFAARTGAAPLALSLSATRGDLIRLAERFREAPDDPEVAARLSRLLLAPVLNFLRQGDRLFVSLEGDLAALPIAALLLPSGHFLIEEHAIALVRQTSALPALTAPLAIDSGAWQSVVVGASQGGGGFASLPDAAKEAARVADFFPGASVLVGAAAERASILRRLPEANFFHFAGHASIARGGLVLGRGLELLSPADLASAAAKLRLVVLSACRTGKTDGVDAEFDISRAILDAGVPMVLATTAPVDDRGALALFERFYPHLHESGDPIGALREAQLAMMRSDDPDFGSPSAWAPFVFWADAKPEREGRKQ